MARGLEAHKLRVRQCHALGKNLSRRAKSKCELCQQSRPLQVVELLPLPEQPTEEWALLLCQECQPFSKEKIQVDDPHRLQFLHESIWSEITPIQVLSIRLTRHLEKNKVTWVQGMLDSLYIDPEIESKL